MSRTPTKVPWTAEYLDRLKTFAGDGTWALRAVAALKRSMRAMCANGPIRWVRKQANSMGLSFVDTVQAGRKRRALPNPLDGYASGLAAAGAICEASRHRIRRSTPGSANGSGTNMNLSGSTVGPSSSPSGSTLRPSGPGSGTGR
jgi:hypothetical protein